jgi:hypothetical protein
MQTVILSVVAGVVLVAGLFAGLHLRTLFQGPDYSRLPAHYPFKSEASRRRYLEYYEKRARHWPGTRHARAVETSFGATWVRSSGPEDAPPLVLLPSGFASSLIWQRNIDGLLPTAWVLAVE